jgi:hypothetical protein
MIKNIVKATALVSLLVGNVQAAEIEVKLVNNTGTSHFTPLLVAAHANTAHLFMTGMPASAALKAMAEGGDISGLVTELSADGANIVENPAGGLLAAGANTVATLTTDASNDSISIVAMILPTNDGFIGLNNWKVPTEPGTYKVNLHAYDAGTEANDEKTSSIPQPGPTGAGIGTGGTGVAMDAEGFVHIHRGILGDTDASGGASDLDSTKHRWLNPIATAIVTVK